MTPILIVIGLFIVKQGICFQGFFDILFTFFVFLDIIRSVHFLVSLRLFYSDLLAFLTMSNVIQVGDRRVGVESLAAWHGKKLKSVVGLQASKTCEKVSALIGKISHICGCLRLNKSIASLMS